MINYNLFLSKQTLTVSSLYDSWHVRTKELCLLRVSGRLSEQQTVSRRTVTCVAHVAGTFNLFQIYWAVSIGYCGKISSAHENQRH